MKYYKQLGIILAGGVLAVGISATWAYFSDRNDIANPFHTSNSAIDMIENYNPAETVLPGETVEKEPYFVNQGSTDLVLRLKMDTYWIDQNGNRKDDLGGAYIFGGLQPEEDDYVTLYLPDGWDDDWVQIEDYYYYKHILPGKEEGVQNTTSNFLDHLTLSPEVSNDEHAADYSGCKFIVDFHAEAVPADELAIEVADWDLTQTDADGLLDWAELLPES